MLQCADELRARGIEATVLGAESDCDIDTALTAAFGDFRSTATQAPQYPDNSVLIVAGDDAVVRAVARRALKRVMPPPRKRPAWLEPDRTIADLPPVGILRLDPAPGVPSLVESLELPSTLGRLAEAVVAGRTRRLDLLRNDHGSLTVHGAMLGQSNEHGAVLPWSAEIYVDDAQLTDGTEQLIGCALGNASGYCYLAGLPLLTDIDPSDGRVSVAVALPSASRAVEVRRASGRAVSVAPSNEVTCTDDGVDSVFSRKKTWWMERSAWAVFSN